MLDERKRAVLRAIVADYVRSREPVGSKVLVERHQLGVSPATIRNDMAILEEEGYIAAPHTSAGRIPTDKGYRLFVDQLVELRPLSPSERRAIQTFLAEPVDLDDAVERTVRLLAQLTKQLAVVQYPSLSRSTVRHVEVVCLSARRVLVVVIAESGRVDQRIADVDTELDQETLAEVRDRINRLLVGCDVSEVAQRLTGFADVHPEVEQATLTAIAAAVAEAATERREDRVVYSGTANLAREWDDFGNSLDRVFEALEEQMVLLRLMGEVSATRDVRVLIGNENVDSGLTNASVVVSGYGTDDLVLAKLGVVGPTRMDYPAAMTAVQAVARYLGRIVTDAG
ncbi:MAG: heat-inducible transcriptional repressor HrcA [Actinobacteria bacterium]|nr:heat-inducible transcriptional repressor HrcA [Actinomycetota bacterium]MCB9413289.1 heat-inducible transcriptional repressor HrcA [Actinomycetota bacterium]